MAFPSKKGSLVAKKTGKVSDNFVVLKVKDHAATCIPKGGGEIIEVSVAELVTVAEFGDPIYPYLQKIDSVCNAPDSEL